MVQHNGAKFVTNKYPKKENYNDFSMTNILEDLHWNTLEFRRMQARTIMAYKIINNNVILEPQMLPKVTNERPHRNCNNVKVGFQNQLFEPQSRIDVANNTFFYATPKLWNTNISPQQAKSRTVDKFKSYFRNEAI